MNLQDKALLKILDESENKADNTHVELPDTFVVSIKIIKEYLLNEYCCGTSLNLINHLPSKSVIIILEKGLVDKAGLKLSHHESQ